MKNVLSNDERIILENIDERYQWITRDKDGNLYVFEEKPTKKREIDIWCGCGPLNLVAFNHCFQFIKWEDEEPTIIAKLLKEK